MSHIGKIGRLPKHLRHKLGLRLEDNVPAAEILQWLDAEPETRDILSRYFQGRSITEQNLSEWRQSGHQDWLRREEAKAAIDNILEHSEDLESFTDGQNLGNRFAAIFAAEMTRLAMALLAPETDPEKKWERLCQIHRELSRLRRDDDRATCTAIRQARWECESQRQKEERQERREQAQGWERTGNIFKSLLKQSSAAHPIKRPSAHPAPEPVPPPLAPVNPKQSRQIQPNPAKNLKPGHWLSGTT